MTMRHGLISALCVVACAAVLCAAAADTKKVPSPRLARGLSAERAAQFSTDYATFTCDGGATVLPATAVNDDYCDCADASDEYGTSACARGTFYCRNRLFVPAVLPSGHVDDGICDCCDGSDEPAGVCANTCREQGAARRAAVVQHRKDVETGLQRRAEMAASGAAVLAAQKQVLADTDAALAEKRPAQEAANKAYDAASDAFIKRDGELRKARDECLLLPLSFPDLATCRLCRTCAHTWLSFFFHFGVGGHGTGREKQEAAKAEAAKAEAAAKEGEKAVQVEGVPNVDINEMVHGGADVAPQPAGATPLEEEHAVPTFLEPEGEEAKAAEAETEKQKDGEAEPVKPEDDEEWKRLRDAKEEARKAMSALNGEVRDLEDKRREASRVLELDVDGDMCLVQLGTECHEHRDKYQYRVCPLKDAKQDHTDLGRFSAWVGDAALPRAKRQMKFEHGSYCWDGPNRNTLVTLRCGAETRLVAVAEPTRCTYTAVLETPCACAQDDLDRAVADEKALLAEETED